MQKLHPDRWGEGSLGMAEPGRESSGPPEDVTVDAVCRGEVIVVQPRRGYRFSIDALLLAHFAAEAAQTLKPAARHAIDLCAGCGVVGLLLARRLPGCELDLVELQPELARLASEGARRSGLGERVRVHSLDLRGLAA